MARDVALRELDQAGFRISNLGTPTVVGDATKTDNQSVPKPSAGAGSPGTSFLAAAADHVHPATEGSGAVVLTVDDPSEQACSGSDVIWEQTVSFGEIPGQRFACFLSAIMRATGGVGKLALQVGGTPGQPDGQQLVELQRNSDTEAASGARGEGDKPVGVALVKLVASTADPAATVFVRGKSVVLRSA